MSGDCGSGKHPLGSENSSTSATPCGVEVGNPRRKKEFGRNERKTVRILTVVAYILCVSLAAVLLSAYYVFLWDGGTKPGTAAAIAAAAAAARHRAAILSKQQYPGGPFQGARIKPNPVSQLSVAFPGIISNQHPTSGGMDPSSVYNLKKSQHSESYPFYYYGNTRPYQHQQIPTPQPLLMTTQILTTLRAGIPTTKPTTTSPTPPFFKIKMDPMI